MPIFSYLVLPDAGAAGAVAERLAAIPGCEVERAENRELLILLTETSGDDEEQALRASLADVEGIRALSLTFGDLSR